MALKAIIENKEEIPEGVESFYEEKDGKFHLSVEGFTEKSRLDEFRESNINLKKQMEEIQSKLSQHEGIDPVQAREALEKVKGLENKELLEKGQFDEILKNKEVEYGGKIEQLTKHAQDQEKVAKTYKDELETYRITSAIQTAVNEVGNPQSSAIADILARAKNSWQIDDKGILFCVDGTGKARYSEKGDQYLSPQEWAKELVQSAPHLFVSSVGGGANGSGTGQNGVLNPWSKENYNLTKQGEILKDNPTLAKRLSGEAGLVLDV
tara:strand:+ start:1039 stop:1836 length:798 start_codon:yes stop_codon:yes gene_type:complete